MRLLPNKLLVNDMLGPWNTIHPLAHAMMMERGQEYMIPTAKGLTYEDARRVLNIARHQNGEDRPSCDTVWLAVVLITVCEFENNDGFSETRTYYREVHPSSVWAENSGADKYPLLFTSRNPDGPNPRHWEDSGKPEDWQGMIHTRDFVSLTQLNVG